MSYIKDKYYTYSELRALLEQWETTYPELIHVESIGKTYEGRDILAAVITVGGEASKKPGILINGNLHSKELVGSSAVLYAMDYMLSHYGNDDDVTGILQKKTLYCIPRVNADGAEACLTTPYVFRGSTRPFHELEDGVYPEDIDGNGEIVKMRIPSANGKWKCDKEDPRIMVPRQKNDTTGMFYDVFQEGLVRGTVGTSLKNARDPYDLDPNRQFPFDWDKDTIGYTLRECSGKYPLYECEVRCLADFVLAHENINTVIDEHSYCGAYISPMEFCQEHLAPELDNALFAEEGEKAHQRTGYLTKQVFPEGCTGVAKGSYTTWLYYELGIAAWCNENWNNRDLVESISAANPIPCMIPMTPPDEKLRQERALLKWNDEQDISYFCEWTEFEHPQLGTVEIGGWREKWIQDNPPEPFLAHECEKALQFILQCIDASPQLTVSMPVVTKKVQSTVVEITVTNEGRFPLCGTYQAERLGIASDLSAEITVADNTYSAQKGPSSLDGGATALLRFELPASAVGNYSIIVSSARGGWVHMEGCL